MNKRRRMLTIALIAIGLTTIAAPAFAAPLESTNPFGSDAFVVLTGRLDVPKGSIASDAIIFNGDATSPATSRTTWSRSTATWT